MEREVKSAVYMGIELTISALIIAIISMSVYIGKALIEVRNQEQYSGNLLAQQSLFNEYMNEQGNIAGSDVVDIIITYAKIYDFAVVDKTSGSANVITYRLSNDDINKFRVDSVTEDMRNQLFSKFKMQQILTSDGYAIQGIVFTTGGTSACSHDELKKIKEDVFNIESEFSSK